MQVEIEGGPAFASGEVTLGPGGAVRVEGGAMPTTVLRPQPGAHRQQRRAPWAQW